VVGHKEVHLWTQLHVLISLPTRQLCWFVLVRLRVREVRG